MGIRTVVALLGILMIAAGRAVADDPAPAPLTLDVPATAPAAEWVPSPEVAIPAAYGIQYAGWVMADMVQIEVRKWFGGEIWATTQITVGLGGAIGGVKRVDGVNRDFSTGETLVHVPQSEYLLVGGERVYQKIRVRDASGLEREVPLLRPDPVQRRRPPAPVPPPAPPPEESPAPQDPESVPLPDTPPAPGEQGGNVPPPPGRGGGNNQGGRDENSGRGGGGGGPEW